jgi:UDP-N-acetyl-D-glucosamine dehydrogenase
MTNPQQTQKRDGQLRVGVIGLGYVGLPLAVTFAESGAQVVGVDSNPNRIAQLRDGVSPIEDIPSKRLQAVRELIHPTTRYADLSSCEAILICAPTPLNANREPDLGPLLNAIGALADVLQQGQLVVLESTTFPGTTRDHVIPRLEESGLGAGEDFNVAFSPERVDPGRTDYTLRNTPKVIGGLTPECADVAAKVYECICDKIVRVSSLEVAELSKLLENIFRSVNIALVNELAMVCDRMKIDIWEVVEAAATKPFGFMRFEPGPGMGGHCLPVDPFYLTWKAREYDISTEFIELAGKVNQQMPYFCLERVERALNDVSKPLRNSRVLIVGVAYKAGVGDLRESPALKLMKLLRSRGAHLRYHDSFVPELPELELTNQEIEQATDDVDLAVIVTAHPDVDFSELVRKVPLVLDLRGVTRGLEVPSVELL